jgi:hypothetical protein
MIYGIYFMAGLLWSGVMLIPYREIRKLVATADNAKRLT